MLTASFDLDWPDFVLDWFSIHYSAGTVTEQVFSFDCFIENEGEID